MSQVKGHSTAAEPHQLCTLCQSYWGMATCLNFTPQQLSRGDEQVPSMPQHLLHSNHRSEIASAAASGCHFCSILMSAVAGCTGKHEDRDFIHDDGPVYISIAVLNEDDCTFLLTLFGCEQSKIFSHDQVLNSFQLRLKPIDYHDDATFRPSRELPLSRLQSSTYSKETGEFIKSWILECQTSHPLCGDDFLSLLLGTATPTARPRRLLDLDGFQDPERIRLVDVSNDPKFEYCTLSYSWGFSKPYVMTSSNLAEFQKEIYVQSLPKLLRDAIQVVRGIGYRYLWIDALCIMQDGRSSQTASDDWFDQAGKMNDIFGNSVITLAGAEAFDGNQSLILPRNPLSHLTCRLDFGINLCYEVVPACTPYCVDHTFDKARYHLDTRAWVFQERILAPRTAHFTRNFAHLECRTDLRCEAMAGADGCHHSGSVGKAEYQTLFSMFGLGGLEDAAVDAFFSFWHELVRRYSATNLSRNSDLLVALAGLAKQVQSKSQLTWSFGLWREHLLRDMLWYVRGGKGSPCHERAPTWSWASIEVQGPQIMYEPSMSVLLDAEIIAFPETSDFARQPDLSVEESMYLIKLKGRLKRGAPDLDGHNRKSSPSQVMDLGGKHSVRTHRNCQGMRKLHPECPFHPDYDLPQNMELYSLLVAQISGRQERAGTLHSWNTQVGLVLTPVAGHQSRYRRVGYFHHDMQREMIDLHRQLPSLFEDSELVEMEIV